MSTTNIDSLRIDNYIAGGFEDIAQSFTANYEQSDYDSLNEILDATASTGMQLGCLLAPVIVELFTSFEFGHLPTPVVMDAKGKTDKDLTSFGQKFFAEQQANILRAISIKNGFGDSFAAFNIDRNIEAISPKIIDPSFSYFSKKVVAADIIEARYIKNPNTGQKIKILTKRRYDNQKMTFETVLDTKSKLLDNIQIKPKLEIPNPIGVCPVVHLPNRIWQSPNNMFGWSDFFRAIPYFLMFHKALVRGFESQQYSGRPILVIKGIKGQVKTWISRTFNIDVDSMDTDVVQQKIQDFFKKNKVFFFADDVVAEFIESKIPIGKTGEILDYCVKQIARVTGIPEFMFGASVEAISATTREQYSGVQAIVDLKRAALEKALRDLLRWAFVFYTTYKRNEETDEVLETYGLWSNLEKGADYTIDLHWPELLGSDERIKVDTVNGLLNAGALSRQTAGAAFPNIVANPVSELDTIEEEQKRFQPPEPTGQSTGKINSDQRDRDLKSNQTSNNPGSGK